MTRALIIFGAGPGISDHIAAKFASKGLDHIILLARNIERLQNEDAPFVTKASKDVKVDTVQLDLADRDSIPGVLKHLDELTKGDDIEVVLFNAARIKQYPILDVNVDEIHEDFKIQTLALYLVAQHYIPKLQSVAKSGSSLKPAFLVTNSHLPWDPAPTFLSLSLNKASQRNMTWSFRRAFADSGVHIGLISVQGAVSPENKVLNPITIAERAYGFWEAGDQGALEVEIKEG